MTPEIWQSKLFPSPLNTSLWPKASILNFTPLCTTQSGIVVLTKIKTSLSPLVRRITIFLWEHKCPSFLKEKTFWIRLSLEKVQFILYRFNSLLQELINGDPAPASLKFLFDLDCDHYYNSKWGQMRNDWRHSVFTASFLQLKKTFYWLIWTTALSAVWSFLSYPKDVFPPKEQFLKWLPLTRFLC